MRVSVNPEVCVGAGQCVLASPEVFDQDDDGVVTLISDRPDRALRQEVQLAAARCPVEAIGVLEP
jgi:ferredoxin